MRRNIMLVAGMFMFSNLFSQKKDSTKTSLQFKGSADIYWRFSANKTTSVTSMTFDHNSFSLGGFLLGL